MTVVDEVIAQVNDDVITLSMLKRETKERIEALKQNGMTEQQATEEVTKKQAELIAMLINEKLLLQRGKELDMAADIEAEVNRRMLQIAQRPGHHYDRKALRGNARKVDSIQMRFVARCDQR